MTENSLCSSLPAIHPVNKTCNVSQGITYQSMRSRRCIGSKRQKSVNTSKVGLQGCDHLQHHMQYPNVPNPSKKSYSMSMAWLRRNQRSPTERNGREMELPILVQSHYLGLLPLSARYTSAKRMGSTHFSAYKRR